MVNHLSFYADEALQQATAFALRFLYCGGVVKEISPVTVAICNCKLTASFWHPCNEIKTADTVELIADDTLKVSSPITINQAEK